MVLGSRGRGEMLRRVKQRLAAWLPDQLGTPSRTANHIGDVDMPPPSLSSTPSKEWRGGLRSSPPAQALCMLIARARRAAAITATHARDVLQRLRAALDNRLEGSKASAGNWRRRAAERLAV